MGAGLPPGQKAPGGQSTEAFAVEPAAHPCPGGAAQGPLQAAVVRFWEAPNTPAGQGRGAGEPAGQKAPSGHGTHAVAAVALGLGLKEPAGQGSGSPAGWGQKKPSGHAAQAKPAPPDSQ